MSKKSIKYFCAHYCPFSNETSNAYNLINNKFKEKYPDVNIEIFWTEDMNEENKHEYLNAGVEYVPTITNQNYVHIILSLPPNFEKEGKTDEELNDALLEYIYEQLDKEPEKTKDTSENFVETTESELLSDNDNSENNGFLKKTFSSFNNNNFIKCIVVLIITLLIIVPICKKK